ncbi:MAG: prolyl oligopeptidase family serine peptidase [Pseudomonadota bacterium]
MKRHSLLSILFLSIAIGGVAFLASPASACGSDTDCQLGDRTYRIKMPDGWDGSSKVGAIVFMHGYRGTAAGIMRNKSLTKAVSNLGLALIAPKSLRADWAIPNAPNAADKNDQSEFAYFDALIADVIQNHHIDAKRIMASGFSAGGMMVWNLICQRSERFAAFAPIAGTFWKEPPRSCPSPVPHVIHTHGTADKTVPLTGRRIADTKQGDVFETLAMMRAATPYKNPVRSTSGMLTCQRETNAQGKVLELCLHSKGHTFRTEFVVRAWKEFEKLGAMGDS